MLLLCNSIFNYLGKERAWLCCWCCHVAHPEQRYDDNIEAEDGDDSDMNVGRFSSAKTARAREKMKQHPFFESLSYNSYPLPLLLDV